jgi:hypothetical protein
MVAITGHLIDFGNTWATKPADPDEMLDHRRERDYQPDSIDVLSRPVDIAAWQALVRHFGNERGVPAQPTECSR